MVLHTVGLPFSMKLAMRSRTAGFASRAEKIRRLAVAKLWNSLSQMGEGLVNQDLQDFWQTGRSTRDISDVILWYFLWVCDFAKKVKCIELYQEKFS